jgi:hypothetical protein
MTDDINHLPAETIKDLKLNHTYLIRFGTLDTLHSITILLITDKAYHVRWNRETDSNTTWELKERLYMDYTLVENISDFVVDKPEYKNNVQASVLDVKTKLVQCYVCKGFGTIPDLNSTAGNKVCPLCLGAKMIPEVTEISQK